MEAFREIFWNMPLGPFIFYPLGLAALAILVYAIWGRFRIWSIGKPENRLDNLNKRILSFITTGLIEGVFHRKFFREPYPGIIHFFLFAGSILLLIGTALDVINHYVITFLVGSVYLGVSFAADFGGVLMLIGAIMAVIRRYIQKPERLGTIMDDGIALILIFVVVITGYFIEGFRMLVATPHGLTQPEFYSHPDWSIWSFGGYFIASLFSELTEGARLTWYNVLYWFHAALGFGAIYYVCFSFSKLSHILVSPANVFLRSSKPKGSLTAIDIEKAEIFGVSKIENFTWKQLLDLDACTRCGRCQDNCPAYLSEKPLSPKKVILDLKTHFYDIYKPFNKKPAESRRDMLSEVITEDVIWSCTTCRACQEACPVYVEHIDKIVDMRRSLVLEQAKIPETGEAALKCIETRGHSCRGTTATRTDWTEGLDIKLLSSDQNVDIVYWTGCAASLEDRNIKVAKSTAKILKAAGVNFAILGLEESCCGEPARRLGNEYLFQLQAAKNIEFLKNYNVKKIVTSCPHCFNTIKNEYPQFGGEFDIVHHSQFISKLLKQGKIKPVSLKDSKITYHDSCYLGRYNDIYNQPREIVSSISKSKPSEMQRSKETGFCCGGGGGRFWMEERIGKRISEMRVEQVIKTGVDILASACPYCLQMFEDAIKAKEATDTIKALDIAELVASSLETDKKL
jgi:Fe-S oxidoreductase/nitrate reductase gamma subunit